MSSRKKTTRLYAASMMAVLVMAGLLAGCTASSESRSSAEASASASANAVASAASSQTSVGSDTPTAHSATPQAAGNAGSTSSQENGTPSPANPPAADNPTSGHEHAWVWRSNVITITDAPAYEEKVSHWVPWCTRCDCEMSMEHAKTIGGSHPYTEKEIVDGYIHHDAVTHQEDRGWYQCSCGAQKAGEN